jgi:hypothetical protein
MKSNLIKYCLFALVICSTVQAQKTTDPELERVIGKVFLILSEEYTVSGQSDEQPSLWANAKLGRVAYPTSKTISSEIKYETEMVPTESGIVLAFTGPFNSGETQMLWVSAHDTDAKEFQIVVTLPDQRIIGIKGSYGSTFPKKYIDLLISLSKDKD